MRSLVAGRSEAMMSEWVAAMKLAAADSSQQLIAVVQKRVFGFRLHTAQQTRRKGPTGTTSTSTR
jgi:hypothetical protein